MKYSDKVKQVEVLHEVFSSTPHIVLASFSGLRVNQATELRGKLRAAGGSYRVIKNRLAKRAAAGTPIEAMADSFSGPCALIWHPDDPIVIAKTLTDYAKSNPQIELKAALIDAKEMLDEAGVKQLATMPGLPELRAQLLALIQTPATMLVRLLGTPSTQLARVIDARRESQDEAGESGESDEN